MPILAFIFLSQGQKQGVNEAVLAKLKGNQLSMKSNCQVISTVHVVPINYTDWHQDMVQDGQTESWMDTAKTLSSVSIGGGGGGGGGNKVL